MAETRTLTEHDLPWDREQRSRERADWQVIIAWSFDEPERIGQSAIVSDGAVLGRGAAQADDGGVRLVFHQRRPGLAKPTGPLAAPRLSRVQLRFKPKPDGTLEVRSVGRCPMSIRGEELESVDAEDGDVIVLRNALVLYVARRPAHLALRAKAAPFEFGAADAYGVVGESTAAWQLRDEIAIAARSPHHVLVRGPSGAGKELAARAIHGLSHRGDKPIVARNSATFPAGLVDAELFGNAKNYPHSGSPERPGLVGEADGTSLFLDEIGELPEELQARLLRVLDRDGEYQRLGESKVRHSDMRVIAATNRPLESLKHDVLARFGARIEIPPLSERREDVPLLARHVLARFEREAPEVTGRFFEKRGAESHPRLDPRLIEALLRHEFTLQLRELERLLWLAISSSREDFIALTPEVSAELKLAEPARETEREPTADEIRDALAKHGVSEAAKRLGVKSRYALYRLMKRHGIAAREE